MKCVTLVLLLALGAVASATQAWTQNKQYVYEYKVRSMTGIPYIQNQVSGIGLRSKVLVQVQDSNALMVQMKVIGVAQVANQVFPQSWTSWRKELPLTYSPLESSEGLNIPFKVILREGQVEAIEVSEAEPIWIVNIKRGLASQLSLNMVKFQNQYQQNEISKIPEDFQTVEAEPSVTGKCRTYYTVVPLPKYIAELEERDIPQDLKTKNQERPAWIITKTKDYNRCVEKPAFIHSSVVDTNEEGSSPLDAMHKRFTSRTSITRYLIRGQPQQKFTVERVWTEGDYVIRPFATETESIFISSNQTLVLKQEEQIQTPLPEPQGKISKSLVYQMLPHMGSQRHQSQEYRGQYQRDQEQRQAQKYQRIQEELEYQLKKAYQSEQQPWRQHYSQYQEEEQLQALSRDSQDYPQLEKAPRLLPFSGQQVPVSKVKQQILHLLQKVEQEIESIEQLGEKDRDLPLKMVEMSRALQTLDLQQIREVYSEIYTQGSQQNKAQKTQQTLFLDAVAMCGSNPCIVFLKEVIQKREVTGERAAQLLMVLPATIKTPTQEVIQVLVELVKEVKSFQNKQVWYTALLSTATIINRACVDPKTRRHNWDIATSASLPYCTPQAVDLLLPYLQTQIQETKDHYNYFALVQALGNLGSAKAIPQLKQIIYGQVTECKQVRSKAIWSLVRLVKSARNQHVARQLQKSVQAILKPVFASPLEPQEVRMSAFYVILATKPNESFFTEAATGTWFETNQQVGQFVYSTLASLANSSYPGHYNLTKKAAMALPLAKKYNLGAQYSNNVLFNHVIPKRHLGSLLEYAQFSGKHSVIPEQMYFKLKNHMGGFDMPLFESSLQIQGIQNFINQLVGPQSRDQLPDSLNIHTRKDYPLSGQYWLRLMGSMERVFTLETIQEWAKEGIIEYSGEKNYNINYQKTVPLEDIVMVFPIESGLPVYVSKKIPLFISLRGDAEVQMDSNRFSVRRMEYPSDIKLKLNIKPLITTTRMIEAGIASPLTKEVFLSGHKSNAVLSVPLSVEVEYKNKQVQVAFKEYGQGQQKQDLISVKSYPYTAQAPFYSFTSKNVKVIQADQEIAHKKINFGKRYFGLSFEAEAKMPGRFNYASLYDLLRPHNLLTFTQFMAVPHNLRQSEYRLRLDRADSSTQQIKMNFFYDTVHKQFSMTNYEEEEQMEKKYYKHHGASAHFQSMKQAWEQFVQQPQSILSEMESQQYQQYQQRQQEHEQYRQGRYSVRSSEHRRRLSQEEGLQVQTQYTAKTHKFHVDVTLEGRQTRVYRSSVLLSVSPCATKYQGSFMFEREASSGLSQYKVYAKGQLKYPYLPANRQQILDMNKDVLGYLSINYGQTASSKMETKIVLIQTPEWRQKVQEAKVTKECQKYEQEGSPYSPNCLHARREASALNRVVLQIQSQEMPRGLKNATYHADDLFKAYFYPYLTNKRLDVQNPQGQIKIVMDIKPVVQKRPWPLLSLQVYKPRENTFIDEVKMNPWLETVLPLNAEMSVPTKAINKVLGWQYTPFCELGQEFITTFDNVTYKYPLDNCFHLVAKDCSKNIPVAVQAKKTGQGKIIKAQVGKMEVEISPELVVKVDGQITPLQIHEEQVFKNADGRKVLVILRTRKDKVKVTAPIHGLRIKSDGKHFRVEMSNMYRGRVCGLCGDMNGEKYAEFKDPKECILLDAQTFGNSYALDSCSRRVSQSESECVREPQQLQRTSSYSLSGRSLYQGRQQQRRMSSVKYVTKVVPRREETCFSVKPVLECEVGTKPTGHIVKEIGFHCLRRGNEVNQLIAESRSGVLEQMKEKPVDFKEYVSMPEACEPIKGYSSAVVY